MRVKAGGTQNLQQAEHAALRVLERGDGAGFLGLVRFDQDRAAGGHGRRTASATLDTPKYTCHPGLSVSSRVRRDRGDAGHLGAVHHQRGVLAAVVLRVFGHVVPEQLLEESDGGLRLGRQQFGPGQGAGLPAARGAEVASGLPGAGGAAAGRGEEDHHAGVAHRLGAELKAFRRHGPGRRRAPGRRGTRSTRSTGRGRSGGLLLRVLRRDDGDQVLAQEGLRVAAPVRGGQVLEAPAEHRGVESLGRRDVTGLEVRPAELAFGESRAHGHGSPSGTSACGAGTEPAPTT